MTITYAQRISNRLATLRSDNSARGACEAIAAEADAEIERLIAAINAMLHCPCCGETMDCLDDCTFAVDCPAEADDLSVLRDAVRA